MTTPAVKATRDRRGEVWEFGGALLLIVGPPEPYPKFVNCVNHPALNLETGRMVGELETPTHRGTWEELEAWHGSRVRRVA